MVAGTRRPVRQRGRRHRGDASWLRQLHAHARRGARVHGRAPRADGRRSRVSMTIRVANAPCSWGILEFDGHGPALASSQVLDELAATGYAGTELGDWGFMPTDPAALRHDIERRVLTLVGAFVPVDLSDA